ncbi:hypothetical protein [Moraxella sp. ZY210820]|uniref:hypothetical protein n=1 Tax=unclassified Moraxella TaxID=2685852 RepID=UPI00272F462E|nr:hypothetical protein [Moraxella sp. ZY210820]WLF84182.1 hypothetical protein LU301_01390 [Moraxella sp. ZY210820]
MQFLLIGFSEQAQNALELLISREFSAHTYVSIPRKLSTYLYPVIPEMESSVITNTDMFIIDLDGIGMMSFSEEYKTQLLSIIGRKPALLISRQIQQDWQASLEQVTVAHIEYVLQPYSRDNIIEALQRLLSGEQVPVQTTVDETPELTSLNIENHSSVAQAPMGQVAIAKRTQFTRKLLEQRWTNFNEQPVLQHLLNIFSQSIPFKLTISQHEMLVFPEKNMILLQKMQSVVEYFILMKSFTLSAHKIESEPLYSDEFIVVEQEFLQQGCKPYQLNLFLWQIYQEILPEKLELDATDLCIKLNYMPDFTNMVNVPAYMRTVSSACLGQPQYFEQLRVLFKFLTIDNIQRVFLLSVLSNYADISYFEEDILHYKPIESKPLSFEIPATEENEQVKNQQVIKARSQGFFERLLKKLSW